MGPLPLMGLGLRAKFLSPGAAGLGASVLPPHQQRGTGFFVSPPVAWFATGGALGGAVLLVKIKVGQVIPTKNNALRQSVPLAPLFSSKKLYKGIGCRGVFRPIPCTFRPLEVGQVGYRVLEP